jgi:hypothetical protein
MEGVNSAKIGTGGRRFLLARHASTTTRYGELVSIAKKKKSTNTRTMLIAWHLGEAVIQQVRSTRPGYNLISNNCQTYVLQLLDAVRVSQVKEFATTAAVYDRLFGAGKVADLFVDAEEGNTALHLQSEIPAAPVVAPIEGQQTGVIGATAAQSHMLYHHPEALLQQGCQDTSSGPTRQNSIVFAQQVMNANTTQLNSHDEMHRGVSESTGSGFDEQPCLKSKEKSWSKKTSSMFERFKR